MKKRFLSILMSGLMLLSSIQVQAQDIDTTMYKFNTMDNLVVSIPSNIDLSYSSGGFRGEDVVKVEGYRSSSKEYTVDISLDTTNVVYTDGSNSLNGLVSFGSDGVGSWTASEVADGVEKEISIDLIDLPDTEGTYTGSFDYNIKVTKTLIDEGYFTKIKNSDGVTCTITGLTNKGKEWVRSKNGVLDIPDTQIIDYQEYTVTHLGYGAFQQNTDIKLVNIAGTVTEVGDVSFRQCTNLSSLNFNDNSQVKTIGEFAFSECTSLVNAELPEGLQEIKHFAFSSCRIRDLVIPDSCSMLRLGAFYNMSDSLRTLKMPIDCNFVDGTAGQYTATSATLSSRFAFKDSCKYLTDITLTKGKTGVGINLNSTTCKYTPWYQVSSSNLINMTIEEGVTRVGNYYFYKYIPIYMNKLNISTDTLTVGTYAFYKVKPKEILWDVRAWTIESDGFYNFCSNADFETTLVVGDRTTAIPYAMTSSNIHGDYDRIISHVEWGNAPALQIYASSFRYTPLKEIYLPESITSIPDYAFSSTDATVISVPNTVTYVGTQAFSYNEKLTDIYWDATNAVFSDTQTAFFKSGTEDCTIHFGDSFVAEGITTVPKKLFSEPYFLGYSSNIRYVDWGNWKPTSLSIAFAFSNIYELYVPDSVTSIDERAFASTKDLESIHFEKTLTSIGEGAFSGSGIKVVYYNGSKSHRDANLSIASGNSALLDAIWIYAEDEQKPSDIFSITYANDGTCTIDGLTAYGIAYVKGNNGELNIPSEIQKDNVTYSVVGIKASAFTDNTGLKYLYLPKSVTSVGADAFRGTTLETVDYEGLASDRDLITIGTNNAEFEDAFWIYAGVQTRFTVDGVLYEVDWDTNTAVCLGIADSSLSSITIKGNLNIEGTNVAVKSIQANAFNGNTVLNSVVVEEGIERVGFEAFRDCSNLKTVRLADSITDLGEAEVSNIDAGGSTFWQCTSLTSVNIPAGVSVIPRSCFGYCSSLSSIEIPDTIDYIGFQAFRNTALTTVSIPEDTVVSERAFASCSSLVSVDMPASVYLKGEVLRNSDNMSRGVFDRCTALQSVVVPSANPVVAADMFYGCTSLNDITFETGITTIGQAAMMNCTSLKTVTFKSGVTTIKTTAFYECSALNQIYLPVSLRTVETYAFYNCSSLTNGYIYYTGTSSNKSSISVASNNNPFKNSNWVYSSAVVLALRKPVYELVAYDEAINMIALEKTVLTDEIEGAVIAEVNVDDILLAQGYALVDGAESDWLYVTDSNDYCGYVNKQYLSILETEETILYEKNAFDSAIEMTVLSDTSVLVEPDGEEIFEVLSGELIVIHGSVVIDGSESDWYYTEFETGEIGMIRKEFLSEVTDEVLEENVEESIEEVPTVSDNSLDTESEKVFEDLENISDMSDEDEILTDSEHIEVSSDEVSNDEILNEVDSSEESISDGVDTPEATLSDVPDESDSAVLEVQDSLSSDGVDLIEEEVILQEGGEPLNEDIPDVDINEDYIVSSSEEEDVVESDTE